MDNVSARSGVIRRTAQGRRHSASRERVLRVLETSDAALSNAEVVAATGLHENTVRGHLDALYADGFTDRERAPSVGRGRPAWLWRARPEPDTAGAYAELAVALATTLSQMGGDAASAARAAGVHWGERISLPGPSATAPVSAGQAHNWVVDMVRAQGFSPEVVATDAAPRPPLTMREGSAGEELSELNVFLHSCPLLRAAKGHERIVCAVHEGMVEGIARRWLPTAHSELTPFVDERTCALRVRAVS